MKKFFLIITIIIAIFIFYISSLPSPPNPVKANLELIPTLYHIIIFFLFSLFLALSSNKKSNKTIILILAVSIIYGILDELHQFYVPGRSSSLSDIFLDSSGSVLGVIASLFSNKSASP